jgi:hypothetical protein
MFKLNQKVKYIGKRKKNILGQIGVIVATKNDNDLDIKLRSDEYAVDFGFEDDFIEIIRKPQLEEQDDLD